MSLRTRLPNPILAASTLIIFTVACPPAGAQEPPAGLVRAIAEREALNEAARSHYAYRQEVVMEELPGGQEPNGRYVERRDVIFSPQGERSEIAVGEPASTLKRLILTPEDFDDIRNIQPILLTPDVLPRYEVKFRGDEVIDGRECWVLQVRPRQIFQGMRLFDGMIWAEKQSLSIVRSEGQAVPPVYTKGQENLFPRFATTRAEFEGHWFPVLTLGDDTLPFRTGALHVKMTIRYKDYKRFGAESKITFEPQ